MLEINKVYFEDCLEGMKKIGDNSIDTILCDLPYGTSACKWDSVLPFDKLWQLYERIIKDDGSIVLFGSQPFTSTLIVSNLKLFKYSMVWEKSKSGGYWDCKFRPLKSHEDICVFSKGGSANGSKTPMKYNPQGLIGVINLLVAILELRVIKRELVNTTIILSQF
jgi:site-specific DNA-methyltransferase (adenine-specific)